MGFVEVICLLLVAWVLCFVIAVGVAPSVANAANKKEKERKLALLKEYPHLAKEIWQSIEDQDAHHRARIDAYAKSIGDAMGTATAWQPKPKSKSKAAGAFVRTGLIIAKRLIK